MTDQELRRMSRSELLEMLVAQIEENETLKQELDNAHSTLEDRKIVMEQSGSIAEAALRLNGVFETAQAAAQQYLDNVQRLAEERTAACQTMEADARRVADTILSEADAYSQKTHAEADAYNQKVHTEADEYMQKAYAEADAYWKQILAKAKALVRQQEELNSLIESAERKYTYESQTGDAT